MTKRETIDLCNRLRGMLIHLSNLVNEEEAKEAIKETIEEIGFLEDDMGLYEVHSDDEKDEDEE